MTNDEEPRREQPKIGELVRMNLDQLFAFCLQHAPDEFARLGDEGYTRATFGVGFPFHATDEEIAVRDRHTRYWNKHYAVLGHRVRVTNHWFAPHRQPFLRYLLDVGLTPLGATAAELEVAASGPDEPSGPVAMAAPGGARYRLHAVGNAQNSAVRNVLGRLPHESFTRKDWLQVKADFGHACAYCGERAVLVMDHAVPINTTSLGEHRLGNLVPACHPCNSTKGQKSFEEHLRGLDDQARASAALARIRQHMSAHRCTPLTERLDEAGVDAVRDALEELRKGVAELATAAVSRIDEVLER